MTNIIATDEFTSKKFSIIIMHYVNSPYLSEVSPNPGVSII